MDRSVNVTLGGREYIVHRARLGVYLRQQEASSLLAAAGKSGDNGSIMRAINKYLEIAIPEITPQIVEDASWVEIATAISLIEIINRVEIDFALLRFAGEPEASTPVPWEYEERLRYFWVHLLARSYHWTREEIENLWPEDALAFIQEILVHDQYDREFLHSISEIAYQYQPGTKSSKYVPLRRPLWMVLREEHPKVKLHRDLMPIGVVVYPEGEEGLIH